MDPPDPEPDISEVKHVTGHDSALFGATLEPLIIIGPYESSKGPPPALWCLLET